MMLIKTQVAPSGIHGMGLFATEFITRGTPIWRFRVGFDHDFSPEQFAVLPSIAREHTRWFCFVSKEDGHVILSGDHACFINHSATPNTGAPPNAIAPVTTVALRDIAGVKKSRATISITMRTLHGNSDWSRGMRHSAQSLH